jgi:hypothetical protein
MVRSFQRIVNASFWEMPGMRPKTISRHFTTRRDDPGGGAVENDENKSGD